MKMYENSTWMSVYPWNIRHAPTVSGVIFEANREQIAEYTIMEKQSFFDAFQQLFLSIQLPWFHHYYEVENAPYSNHISSSANVYLSYHVTGNCENIMYSLSTKIHAKNVYNSVMSWMYSENVYQSLGILRSSNIFYSRFIQDSHNIWFSTDLVWCHDCIFCHDIQNISYAINNISYPKEVYFQKKDQILKNKEHFYTNYLKMPSIGGNIGSKNTSGKYCNLSEDVQNGYYSTHIKTGRNVLFAGHPDGLEDIYNGVFVSAGRGYYGACAVGGDATEIYNSISMMRSFECYYSYFLERCSFCFGCIWLKNKSYCILNRQYTKEDWYRKVWEIFETMLLDGTFWKFFPATLSPFYFDDSLANLMLWNYDRKRLETKWFLFSPENTRGQTLRQEAIESWAFSQYISNAESYIIDDAILWKILHGTDGKCYTIQKREKDFLEQFHLPIPETHPFTRMMDHLKI
jgi:hypothetical protein